MTCQHCCGADSIFDQKGAEKEFNRYQRKGPNKTTQSLLNTLYNKDLNGMSLLDIGGGIGVIQHELLKKGLNKTTDVDASSSYISRAKTIMKSNKTEDKMTFLHGDFLDHSDHLEKHDIVTLEKVVCCYPNIEGLLNSSSDKAKVYYGLVYPKDNFISKIFIKLTHLFFWLKKNPFRTFVHSEEMMHDLLVSNGFKLIHEDNSSIWRIVLFERVANQELEITK